jgi:hypothetical protein
MRFPLSIYAVQLARTRQAPRVTHRAAAGRRRGNRRSAS